MNAPTSEPSGPLPSSSPSSTAPADQQLDGDSGTPTATHSSCRFLFLELFAGSGHLSGHVGRVLPCLPPQDIDKGGADFLDNDQAESLKQIWKHHADQGTRLIFHVAPPCSTFSRARDRSQRTKLRSSAHPEGIVQNELVKEGNLIAKRTAECVNYLVESLGAVGSWEQPAGSYMLPYLDSLEAISVEREAVLLHHCRFGKPFKKPTVFWLFGGLRLPSLDRRCTPSSPCGRKEHVTLGFGQGSTRDAAAYSDKLCRAYALDLLRHTSAVESAIDRARVHEHGKVVRHLDRGSAVASLREQRDAEDAASRAGPAEVEHT